MGTPEVAAALDAHRDYVMEETLTNDWGDGDWSHAYSVEHTLGAAKWAIGLRKDDSTATVLRPPQLQ